MFFFGLVAFGNVASRLVGFRCDGGVCCYFLFTPSVAFGAGSPKGRLFL